MFSGYKRSMFCEDFHSVTPAEAVKRNSRIMYKNRGSVGSFTSDHEKRIHKVGKMSNKVSSNLFGSSDWFILPARLSKEEIATKFSLLRTFMKWKFPDMERQRPMRVLKNSSLTSTIHRRSRVPTGPTR